MPLSNAAAARGPGGTTSGELIGSPVNAVTFEIVALSVMTLPQLGQAMWSACDEGGAEAGPLLLLRYAFWRSSGFTTPSSEIVIGDGVRREPFRADVGTGAEGVGSPSPSYISTSFELLPELTIVLGMLSTELVGVVKKGDALVAVWLIEVGTSPLSLRELDELDEHMDGLPTLRRFLDSGPHASDALMDASASSAVYMRRAMAPSERKMLSVCQSAGPSYLGMGEERGPSS